jgi:uncharacterized protein (DUF1810 family)
MRRSTAVRIRFDRPTFSDFVCVSRCVMSLPNSPDPAMREAVVRQDLGNVLHPIVQHKVLESKQMVVAGGVGSTIIDADGTEYLDAMAGLWCVNIGYGRTELGEVAAEQMRQLSYFPHTAMNVPAAALAEKINGLMGGGYHTYFVNSGSEANEAGFKIARQYMKYEYPGEYRFKTVSRYFAYHGTTLATLDAGGMGERKAKFEPFSGDFVHVAPHWMWFVFPQLRGLGHSSMAIFYGIGSLSEARAYLAHPLLGPRLELCTQTILQSPSGSLHQIFGSADDLKFQSSMTLFASAAGDPASVYYKALDKWCNGTLDPRR